MIGINPDFDYLYDPQQRRAAGRCPLCGVEIWTPGANLCRRCRRSELMDNVSYEIEVDDG
jgi:hypothetical protein